jgi:hypothetical protein
MNEQRAFTVVVTGCSNCPFDAPHGCSLTNNDHQIVYLQNVKAITPTCPMFEKSKIIGELK